MSEEYRNKAVKLQLRQKCAKMSCEEEQKMLEAAFEKGVVRLETTELLDWNRANKIANDLAGGLCSREDFENSGLRYVDGVDLWAYASRDDGGIEAVQLGAPGYHDRYISHRGKYEESTTHELVMLDREEWLYKHIQQDHIFAKRSAEKNPEFVPRDFTKEKEMLEEQGKKKGGSSNQVQPVDVEFINGGVWTAYYNIDMCGQGDVDIIGDWQQSHSIDDLKRKCEQKGYSAFAISPDSQSFAHAALKKFSYNLTPLHCKPTHYECHIYIWNTFGSGSSIKDPAIGKQMKLVKRGSKDQAVFQDIELLKEGKVASTKLSSHGGKVSMGKQYYEEKRFDVWRYIESQCVAEDDDNAVYIKYVDDNFVKLVNLDLVLDVAFWKMDEGNVVNFVGGTNEDAKTKQGGGGRDWTLNDDGTISAKHHPHLCLGF